MNRDSLSLYADIMGLVTGFMALIGIGGVLSWSLFDKQQSQISERVLAIFAYSIKTALCLLLLGLMVFLTQWPWFITIESTGGNLDYYASLDGHRRSIIELLFSEGNLIGTAVTALWFIPAYTLFSACIYRWSFQPLKAFWTKFKA